jgi:hypothetical protein
MSAAGDRGVLLPAKPPTWVIYLPAPRKRISGQRRRLEMCFALRDSWDPSLDDSTIWRLLDYLADWITQALSTRERTRHNSAGRNGARGLYVRDRLTGGGCRGCVISGRLVRPGLSTFA